MKQEQRSVKEVHSELGMHSVRFAKDEQGRRKEQQVLFKWPEVQKKLGEHKHIYVVDARLGSNNHTHRLWYSTTGPLSLALGQAVYEDERYPEFWVYAQEGEDARKTLIPGGGGEIDRAKVAGSRVAELYAEEVGFAMHEEQLRRKSKVLVKQKDLVFEPTAMGRVAYVVDPRIGFQSKALGVVMAEIPSGKRSGAHRHLYDEIDLIVGGRGKVIVADKEYEFDTLDVLSIPVFQWHQYFNKGTEPLRIVAINTRLALENLGLSLTHQGELADY